MNHKKTFHCEKRHRLFKSITSFIKNGKSNVLFSYTCIGGIPKKKAGTKIRIVGTFIRGGRKWKWFRVSEACEGYIGAL